MLSHDDAVTALERNCWAIFSSFANGPGGRLTDTPTELVVESPVAKAPYNGIFRMLETEDASLVDRVRDVWQGFTDRGVDGMVLVTPNSPDGLRPALRANGLELVEVLHGMAMELDDLPPVPPLAEGVDAFEATTDDAADWLHLVSWRYGLEPTTTPYLRTVFERRAPDQTRLWVARMDGEPVSKVVLQLHDGVAGIYGVTTTERGRRRGLATHLTLRALHAARDAGATVTILHSTPMARGLYGALGYRDVADFEIWAAPDSLHL